MKIIEEKCFLFNDNLFIARLFKPKNKGIYGEIVFKNNGKRSKNMKDIVRQYLLPYNIEISTDAKEMNTHMAVKILMKYIPRNIW